MMNDRSDKVFVDSNMIIFAADFKNANVFEWINELYQNIYIHKEVYNELLFPSVKKAVDKLIASGEWIFLIRNLSHHYHQSSRKFINNG